MTPEEYMREIRLQYRVMQAVKRDTSVYFSQSDQYADAKHKLELLIQEIGESEEQRTVI